MKNFRKYLTVESVLAAIILIVVLSIFLKYKWMVDTPL